MQVPDFLKGVEAPDQAFRDQWEPHMRGWMRLAPKLANADRRTVEQLLLLELSRGPRARTGILLRLKGRLNALRSREERVALLQAALDN